MKSVDLTQAQSISDGVQDSLRHHENVTNLSTSLTLTSIMTSPITTKLTALRTYMPFSWGAPAPALICTVHPPDSSMGNLPSGSRLYDQDGLPQRRNPHLRGFVTRRQQLEKLKKRMDTEGRRQLSTSAIPHCKSCVNGTVAL